MPENKFHLLINSEFEHNESPELYFERIQKLKTNSNVRIVDMLTDDEISWETKKLPKWLSNNKPDLLHMPTNRICLNTLIPQVATFHDCMEWKFIKKIHAIPNNANFRLKLYVLKKRFYVWLIYKWGLRKAKHVTTISNFAQKSLFEEFSFLRRKSSFVYHGIPNNYKVDPEFSRFENRHGVLMLGGDSYQKNPENAIKAWSLLPDALRQSNPLIIAGFTGNETSPISKTIKELGLTEHIVIKNWLAEDELVQLFQRSKLLMFVSREEGFGFPLTQALACGTPVVTSTAEVLLEIGQNACNAAPAEDPIAISKVLLSLLNSNENWRIKHEISIKRSRAFDWGITTQHIKNIYEQQLS
jgi:glycosyltransferase involved in cell wall biosynthesis